MPTLAARVLSGIERIGNRLPDPTTLFVVGTVLIMLLSQLAVSFAWEVDASLGARHGVAETNIQPRSLLSADGLWWLLSHLVDNFIHFPPLGIVLVGMLGIGLAERVGLLPALLNNAVQYLPRRLLAPSLVFLGIVSSLAMDAGYVVLPPLAAALYLAAGRPPLAGIAAVFAGVSAGFGANLVITGLDPMLAGLSQSAAAVIDPDYEVAVTSNWWFMIASTVVLTLTGWAVTTWLVEPRLTVADSATCESTEMPQAPEQNVRRGLRAALLALVVSLLVIVGMVWIPGAPLYGEGSRFPRWVEATVPLLFFVFVVPGIVYGRTTGTLRSDKDIAQAMGKTMASLGPYIVLAFFAAQFIEVFKYSRLGEMLALYGGALLSDLNLPRPLLMLGFILVVVTGNLFIGSMSAKYAFLAPVFVPMFMLVGISPELTQVAYRVGDSVSNVITPLNPYMIIILALVQRYAQGAGLGSVIAMMLPYSVAYMLVWTAMLLVWMIVGLPLGPEGVLLYPASASG